MDGPGHYREAENALAHAWSGEATDPDLTVATAQVHATLALAAASVLYTGAETWRPGEAAWSEVLK